MVRSLRTTHLVVCPLNRARPFRAAQGKFGSKAAGVEPSFSVFFLPLSCLGWAFKNLEGHMAGPRTFSIHLVALPECFDLFGALFLSWGGGECIKVKLPGSEEVASFTFSVDTARSLGVALSGGLSG